jgi:predicted  nucleic acid-binding Zn-ribbon protein
MECCAFLTTPVSCAEQTHSVYNQSMSQTLTLYRLQQVDTQIDRVQIRLNAIQVTLEDNTELKRAVEYMEKTDAAYKNGDQILKQAETDAHLQRIKIEQTEASLYGGKGHTPKELLDLQNDVAALKRRLTTLEDVQLEAMLNFENLVAESQSAKVALQNAQDLSAEQNKGLLAEQMTLRKELEKLFSERTATAGPIPPDILGLYDRLRQQRRGIAVSVISENSCSSCGSGLSAAQMQSSRASAQIAFCPSCGRILYGS